MIELKITAGDADELFAHLHGLADKNVPVPPPIDFVAAKAQEVRIAEAQDARNKMMSATIQTYEPDADDEAEVDPDIVQGEERASENVSALDSAGDEWDEAIHSPNKTMTKDGRWRLKKGAVRPESSNDTSGATATPQTSEAVPSTDAGPTSSDEEDEFAAFAEAMAEEPAEAPEVMARTWTDADLSKLCNQAAQKLGNPAPIKDTIAKFVPEGEVPHSRNVPVEGRAEFAAAIEKVAGIEFIG